MHVTLRPLRGRPRPGGRLRQPPPPSEPGGALALRAQRHEARTPASSNRPDHPLTCPLTPLLASPPDAVPPVRRRRPRLRLLPRRLRGRGRGGGGRPAYAIEPYLEAAAQHDVRIVRVLETHTHADHVSGHGRLALEHGVPVSIHPRRGGRVSARPARGRRRARGRQRHAALHPHAGAPPRALLLPSSTARGEEPWLLLTGDSLFVGDAARPDLAVEAREGAEGLFRTLHRLLELPTASRSIPATSPARCAARA